jgi:hypothetical protein
MRRVPPVVLDELLADGERGQNKSIVGIVANFNGQIRQGCQQGVFVRRSEQALGKQTLNVG